MKVLFRIASGLYPCLWCHIRQEQMSVPREERCVSQVLTMEGIKKDYQRAASKKRTTLENKKLTWWVPNNSGE